jgi:hypothetical protein
MRETIIAIFKANAGPLAFILIASGLCWLLPIENRTEVIYLVIGAALTRVKRTDKS